MSKEAPINWVSRSKQGYIAISLFCIDLLTVLRTKNVHTENVLSDFVRMSGSKQNKELKRCDFRK